MRRLRKKRRFVPCLLRMLFSLEIPRLTFSSRCPWPLQKDACPFQVAVSPKELSETSPYDPIPNLPNTHHPLSLSSPTTQIIPLAQSKTVPSDPSIPFVALLVGRLWARKVVWATDGKKGLLAWCLEGSEGAGKEGLAERRKIGVSLLSMQRSSCISLGHRN
jgi:hypothetical protein